MDRSYGSLARAFDRLAPAYDDAFGRSGNAVMRWMRAQSLALLRATFPVRSRLLEIGCGTGEEALALAGDGYRVLATDVSPAMAARTAARARAEGLGPTLTALALPAGQLHALQPPAPFDGAFASFGSLNCEPHLERLVGYLADLLRPGAAFVCSVMSRWCLFECAWFLSRGRPREAFRRARRGWHSAPIEAEGGVQIRVPVRYFSPNELKGLFSPAFALERTHALPLLLPPPYLAELYARHPAFFGKVVELDRRLRARWPWSALGDHFMQVYRRR